MRRNPGLDAAACHYTQSENQEGTNTHGPRKPKHGNELGDHYWHDDASKTGATGHDTHCQGTLLVKPCDGAVHRWIEEKPGTKGTANSLCKENLIILSR